MTFNFKKCTVEKISTVYINNAIITQNMRLYTAVNGFILETCHICMESLNISLYGNVNNKNVIKKSHQKFDLPLIEMHHNTSIHYEF